MLRTALKTYLPLILAAWFSLFLGMGPAHAEDLIPLGSFGPEENWHVALGAEDGAYQCLGVTANIENEAFGIILRDDGSLTLAIIFEEHVINRDQRLDLEIRAGTKIWKLVDIEASIAGRDTTLTFNFAQSPEGPRFLGDLLKNELISLHKPGVDEPFSIWFFAGYAEALSQLRTCQRRIQTPSSQDQTEEGRPDPKPSLAPVRGLERKA